MVGIYTIQLDNLLKTGGRGWEGGGGLLNWQNPLRIMKVICWWSLITLLPLCSMISILWSIRHSSQSTFCALLWMGWFLCWNFLWLWEYEPLAFMAIGLNNLDLVVIKLFISIPFFIFTILLLFCKFYVHIC